MVLGDKHGNVFNVEAVIKYEQDPKELKLLCRALLEQLQAMERIIRISRSKKLSTEE